MCIICDYTAELIKVAWELCGIVIKMCFVVVRQNGVWHQVNEDGTTAAYN